MVNKSDIIDSLYKIMCSSTTTAVDSTVENNDYFKRRVLGFRAEIEFEEFIKKYSHAKLIFLEGGQFISTKRSGFLGDKNKFMYTTIDTLDPKDYSEVYKLISQWDEVENLFYIKLNSEIWSTEDFEVAHTALKVDKKGNSKKVKNISLDKILAPTFEIYEYDKDLEVFTHSLDQSFLSITKFFPSKKNKSPKYDLRKRDQFDYLDHYDLETLIKIYATRYFVDNILIKINKNLIDLDGFVVSEDNLILVEVKEKSPAIPASVAKKEHKENWTYGWDSRRLLWYLYLQKKIQLSVLYNVRQIDDRKSRNFVQWDSLYIDEFLNGVSWSASRGGGGGENTLMAPYLFFRRLDDVLKDL
jgi:hypothetical protein